jgi:hypothetical protein
MIERSICAASMYRPSEAFIARTPAFCSPPHPTSISIFTAMSFPRADPNKLDTHRLHRVAANSECLRLHERIERQERAEAETTRLGAEKALRAKKRRSQRRKFGKACAVGGIVVVSAALAPPILLVGVVFM